MKTETVPAPPDDEDDEMEDVSAGPSSAAGPSTSKIAVPAADQADEDEFEETRVPAASTNSAEDTAEGVDPNTMVMGRCHLLILAFHRIDCCIIVNGEAMPFSQVQDNEDLLDQMTADEYSVSDDPSFRTDAILTSHPSFRRTSVCSTDNRCRQPVPDVAERVSCSPCISTARMVNFKDIQGFMPMT